MSKTSVSVAPKNTSLYKFEVQQSIELFKTQFTVLTNILTVFVIANISIIGYAFANRISSVFLAGALFPLFMLYISHISFTIMVPVVYAAIAAEKQIEGEGDDFLCSTCARFITKKEFINDVYRISAIPSRSERVRYIIGLKRSFLSTPYFVRYFSILIFLSIAQILFAFYLSWLPGWSLL